MAIHAVIFDYGKVLCFAPEPSEFERLTRLAATDGAAFLAAYWKFRGPYDRGELDGPAYWRSIGETTGQTLAAKQIEKLIATDTSLWINMNPVMLEFADALARQGLKTAILSNMPADISAYLRKTAAWLKPFTALCFSAEMGHAKPDRQAFDICLRGVGAAPQEALFIDDHPENIDAARALGLHAVRFETAPQLAGELSAFELPVSLAELVARAGGRR